MVFRKTNTNYLNQRFKTLTQSINGSKWARVVEVVEVREVRLVAVSKICCHKLIHVSKQGNKICARLKFMPRMDREYENTCF